MKPYTNSGEGTHQVVRLLYLGAFPVIYFFDADANELAVSNIKNSYFYGTNAKEEYNQLGKIAFEKYLAKQIQEDLLKRKAEEKWAELAYEKASCKSR